MQVLVAGAGGFLGRPVVRALASAGHEVVALVHRSTSAGIVEASGARAAVGDVLEPRTIAPACAGADAVVHLAAGTGATSARVRVEGCRNLIEAAKAAGARRFLLGSGYWLHGHCPDTITERTPPSEGTPGQPNLDAERTALAAHAPDRFDVVIARPGMVYGPGGWFASMVHGILAGTYRFVGEGTNHWSPVYAGDVGDAFRLLLERGEPGNAYLVVDDEPVPVRAFAGFIAGSLGVPPPRGTPRFLVALRTGASLARARSANQAASNAKLRGLGWQPRFPSFRQGVPIALDELLGRNRPRPLG